MGHPHRRRHHRHVFVRFATDIDRAHEIMDEEGRRIPIVAKIEKPQALENLEDIVKTFDGVMAARGDMAVECPLEEVPLATKRIIELARQYAKPVIVATEVLAPWSTPRFRPVQRLPTAPTPCLTVPTPR